MKEFEIKANDADQRVDRFLQKVCIRLPQSVMQKWIRQKKIKVNRKRCSASQRLQTGDILQCFVPDTFFESAKDHPFLHVPATLDILYEDEHIILANKPKNLLSQKDQKGIQDTMQDRLLHYLYQKHCYDPQKDQSFTPAFIHRLDRNTAGLMIAGKTAPALRILNEKMKNREIKKYYLCEVEGVMEKPCGECRLYLRKDRKQNKSYISKEPKADAQLIHTSYRVIKQYQDHALVEVLLHTGKSHQIRSTFAYMHHPLVGDHKYGAKTRQEVHSQKLIAYRICFAFTSDAGILNKLKDQEFVLPKEKQIL